MRKETVLTIAAVAVSVGALSVAALRMMSNNEKSAGKDKSLPTEPANKPIPTSQNSFPTFRYLPKTPQNPIRPAMDPHALCF